MLCSFHVFIWIYINNIIIFSQILNDYLNHLYQLFFLLSQYNIVINSKKAYIDFLTIWLLEQKISLLDFFTMQDKIETIVKLNFSKNLKNLKIYLDLTEWLCQYMSYYAYIAESLQQHKTLLARSASFKRESHTCYFKAAILHAITEKKNKTY